MSSAIQLTDTIPALSELTVASNRITSAFEILQFAIHFPSGCDNQVRAYPLLCFDKYISTSGVPPGTSLLSPGSPREYLLGDAVTLTVITGRIVIERGAVLKCHFNNLDAFSHNPVIIFTIREWFEEPT